MKEYGETYKTFNIMLVGNKRSGKTTLIRSIINNPNDLFCEKIPKKKESFDDADQIQIQENIDFNINVDNTKIISKETYTNDLNTLKANRLFDDTIIAKNDPENIANCIDPSYNTTSSYNQSVGFSELTTNINRKETKNSQISQTNKQSYSSKNEINDKFSEVESNYTPTIHCDFQVKTYTLPFKILLRAKYWDSVGGLECFDQNIQFYKYCDVVILCIAKNNLNAVKEIELWKKEIQTFIGFDIKVVIVLTKANCKEWGFKFSHFKDECKNCGIKEILKVGYYDAEFSSNDIKYTSNEEMNNFEDDLINILNDEDEKRRALNESKNIRAYRRFSILDGRKVKKRSNSSKCCN